MYLECLGPCPVGTVLMQVGGQVLCPVCNRKEFEMATKQIVGLDKAHAFWGLAKDGELVNVTRSVNRLDAPSLWARRKDTWAWSYYGKPVKVYVLVEDE